MSVPAVLVDGAGNMRELVLTTLLPAVRVPIEEPRYPSPQWMPMFAPHFGAVDLELLGCLPDGRHVYGQTGIGFGLWWFEQEFTRELSENLRRDIGFRDMHDAIEPQSSGPIVVIYDHEEEIQPGLLRRVIWGVAKPRAAVRAESRAR